MSGELSRASERGMLGELWRASRPFSWINTALPFLALAWAIAHALTLPIVLGLIYFLAPYNLLLYGVNDLYDYESDRRNPRKGGAIEGGLVAPARARSLWLAVGLTNVPLLIAIALLGGPPVAVALLITVAVALAYSVPPVRTKVVPGLDSATSSLHFVLPCICGGLIAGASLAALPWRLLTAFFLWGMASQALGAIQDVRYDREGGIGSIAVTLGGRRTALLSLTFYLAAVLLVASAGAIIPALALLPYALLAASCLGGDRETQARYAWQGFLGMNLLVGFIITQCLLWGWGADSISPIALLAWGSALGIVALLANVAANELAMVRRAGVPSTMPSLAVIVPARNEARTIAACLEGVQSQRYSGPLQILAVDDGSTDGTPEIATQYLGGAGTVLCAGPAPGWSGKCWAAHVGASSTDSEILLFLDADTVLEPGALRSMVAELTAQGGGMVTFLTRYRMESTVEQALVPAFAQMLLCFLPLSVMNRSGAPVSLSYGYGPCMVVTRAAYLAAGGHDGIHASQRDELDLPRAVARAGYPVRVLHGADLAATRHYGSMKEIAGAWRRIYYPYSGHSLALSLFGIAGMAAVFLLPVILPVLAWGAADRVALSGSLLALVSLLLLRVTLAVRENQPLSTVLWHPVTWAVTLTMLTLSVADGLRGRAPRWRDRAMPVGAVR